MFLTCSLSKYFDGYYMLMESSTVGKGRFENGTDKCIMSQVGEKLGCFSSRGKLVIFQNFCFSDSRETSRVS